jgi:hypothetical protein
MHVLQNENILDLKAPVKSEKTSPRYPPLPIPELI